MPRFPRSLPEVVRMAKVWNALLRSRRNTTGGTRAKLLKEKRLPRFLKSDNFCERESSTPADYRREFFAISGISTDVAA
jgi:hypothetical protein